MGTLPISLHESLFEGMTITRVALWPGFEEILSNFFF